MDPILVKFEISGDYPHSWTIFSYKVFNNESEWLNLSHRLTQLEETDDFSFQIYGQSNNKVSLFYTDSWYQLSQKFTTIVDPALIMSFQVLFGDQLVSDPYHNDIFERLENLVAS